MPVYLQAYLNLAYDRLEEQKKEAGRITNIDLQKKVSIFNNNKFNLNFNFTFAFLNENFNLGCFNILLFMRRHFAICSANSNVSLFCIDV